MGRCDASHKIRLSHIALLNATQSKIVELRYYLTNRGSGTQKVSHSEDKLCISLMGHLVKVRRRHFRIKTINKARRPKSSWFRMVITIRSLIQLSFCKISSDLGSESSLEIDELIMNLSDRACKDVTTTDGMHMKERQEEKEQEKSI